MSVIREFLQKERGRLVGVYQEPYPLDEPFIDFAGRFCDCPGTVLLLSGGEGDSARFNILGLFPDLILTGSGRKISLRLTTEHGCSHENYSADPFGLLEQVLGHFDCPQEKTVAPLTSGLLGYLSYDLKDQLERLPRTTIDPWGLPELYFVLPRAILVEDRHTGGTTLHIPRFEKMSFTPEQIKAELLRASTRPEDSCVLGKVNSTTSHRLFIRHIDAIRERIRQGRVYQVNYSQQFQGSFDGSAFALFRNLFQRNPAPFYGFINAGDHQIVSTSPERFVCQNGSLVETRPIKGTRPRGQDVREDNALRDELLSSEKDDAELAMIVDLMRNDLGKVCRLGSVRVREHKRIESYRNVHHMVSIVDGVLADEKSAVDLLRASFPGGSITGCPKISAMRVIDELEGARRHIYTGSIGYLSFHKTMDLSIAIRTATVFNNRIRFSAGGGIVYDSDPQSEFEETLHKAQSFFEQESSVNSSPQKCLWMNGQILPQDEALLPVQSGAFQYGYGLFETLKVEQGEVRYLAEHLERLQSGWGILFRSAFPDLAWTEIAAQLLSQNGLENASVAMKIMASKAAESSGAEVDLVVSVRPYRHRLDGCPEKGLHLGVYPEPRQTPLADLKSLNHLYYIRAGEWAAQNGFDEALILNPDGSVSEGNSTNLLLIEGQTVVIPQSEHVLGGIMQSAVLRALEARGYTSVRRRVLVDELRLADQVLLCNSLLGVVAVLKLDGVMLNSQPGFCDGLNIQ